MRCRYPFLLLFLSVAAAGIGANAADDNRADEETLRAANIATDGPALLKYLENLTVTARDRDRIKSLIKQLGDDSFEEREKATNRLIALGQAAVALLKEATRDPDLEVVRRAEHCLKEIEHNAVGSHPAAACRLIARKKPVGAIPVLLSFLPCAEDETVADEVRSALAAVAIHDGKADPALLAALADKSPVVRGSVAEALVRAHAPDANEKALALLKDAEPIVRLRAGVALAHARDKRAMPVLIELLARLSPEQLWPVEDMLLRLADDQAPSAALGTDEESRKKCHAAWETWWKAHGDKLDLATLDAAPKQLGYTLLLLLDKGTLMELDKDKKERWHINDLQFPLDVQYLPGDRVLLAEQEGGRVTERNHKGEVLWEKKFDAPLMAQRLPGGNTFIANRTQLLEVDRTGKEVFSYIPSDGSAIMRAVKLRNGDRAMIQSAVVAGAGAAQYVRLDSRGKERHRFAVNVGTSGGRVDVLPNGHVLIPLMHQDKVIEYDTAGKAVWEVNVEQPIVAVRLPSGNTLVTSMRARRAVEFDKNGKEVWEFKCAADQGRVTRALRR